MIARNNALLQGLVQQSIKFIWRSHEEYRRKVDIIAAAFSAGKDPIVLS